MQVIGHRGAAALAPENTWASFDRALALGVDAIETDIRASSDGVLVLIHDERLERTTDDTGLVSDKSWSQLSRLDAGSWFASEYAGARIARLDEMLERYGHRTHIALEIKQPGVEVDVLNLARFLGLMQTVTFTSFDFDSVTTIRRLAPDARIGFLTPDVSPENVARTAEAGLDQFCPPASEVSSALVSTWRETGMEVRAWGVKTADLMQRAIDAGVDGMTVDFPHLLLESLGRAGRLSE